MSDKPNAAIWRCTECGRLNVTNIYAAEHRCSRCNVTVELESDPAEPGSYKQARGVFDWQEGDEPAEDTIRRIRGDDDPTA